MTGSQLTEASLRVQVFLEEFAVLLDAGCTVATICGKLDAQPAAIESRLRRHGRQDLASVWLRRCRAAGIDT